MILFILTLAFTYLLYYLFIVRKYDTKGKRIEKKKKKGKVKEVDQAKYPAEVEIFLYKYKVDIKKINFRGFLKLLGFTCSIDIAIIVTIVDLIPIKNMYLSLGIGAILVIPVVLISFALLGKYFKKKGLTKNV